VKRSLFRGEREYWTVDVGDLAGGRKHGARKARDQKGVSKEGKENRQDKPEVDPEGESRLEVWGLSGWYLSLLMWALKVYV